MASLGKIRSAVLCFHKVVAASSRRTFSSTASLATQSKAGEEGLTIVHEENGIRTITLNNTKKRNALSLAMLETLRKDISHDVNNEKLRVIVIKANGPVFSSGHDLKELTNEYTKQNHVELFSKCSEVMKLVQDVTVPVIAQVRGLATAAGCQLVASCDIAVCTDTTKFATPGVSIGLFCSTPGVAVARAVPRKVALEMLFTGHPINAERALLHGLVSKVVPEEKLEEETQNIAKRICETSRIVTALGKACFYSQIEHDRNTAYKQAENVMVSNLALKDGQEGIKAFIEKRKPVWTHGVDS
ncbi:enoyl-CoA hydratase domain-containing protein 3, mitochondrial-like [Lineus longissimus]|uniref:enoyl-CoA hydratase domain-containing protein 3, mitochondrial-like n=1 Tax=Lineus longissimus TaxID=88925 RepID=UPI002B4C5FAD